MSLKFFFVILLAVVYSKAQDNSICDCNTANEKENEDLWELFKKLEKLATEVPDKDKLDYAVVPGNLYQLGCNCDDKLRKKREVAEIEHPEEVDEDKTEELVEEVREKRYLVNDPQDLRCPKGAYYIHQARTCVRLDDDNESEEQ